MFQKARFLVAATGFLIPLAGTPAQTPARGLLPVPALMQASAPDKSQANKSDSPESKEDEDHHGVVRKAALRNPTLWEKPEDIPGLDMYNGRAREAQACRALFFPERRPERHQPKVRRARRRGHQVAREGRRRASPGGGGFALSVGDGYFVNEDYVLPQATIPGLTMKRKSYAIKGEDITDARFARKPGGQKKLGIWQWKDNPFLGTREFNGLRVMMAVLNNWDLKDVNNAVYTDSKSGRELFLVSDIGATFATNNIHNNRARDKGNVDSYEHSKFVTKVDNGKVSFGTPKPPAGFIGIVANVPTGDYMRRMGFDWIGHDIPVADAQWIGGMLGQLSHQQIVDAFRAGHFPPEDITRYVAIVESRIAELKSLSAASK